MATGITCVRGTEYGPFTVVTHYTECLVREVIQTGFQGMADKVAGPLRLALVLYVLVYGILILMGDKQNELSLGEVAKRVFKFTFVVMLASNLGNFNAYVFNGLWEAYTSLGSTTALRILDLTGYFATPGAIARGSVDGNLLTVGAILDIGFQKQVLGVIPQMLGTATNGVGRLLAAGWDPRLTPFNPNLFIDFPVDIGIFTMRFPVPNLIGPVIAFFTSMFMIPIVAFCMLFFYTGALFMYISASFSFMLVVLLAPIFICFFLFDATKGYATTWIGAAVAATLMPAALQICLAAMAPFTLNPVALIDNLGLWAPAVNLGWTPVTINIVINTLIIFSLGKFLTGIPALVNGLVGNFANPGGGLGEQIITAPQAAAEEGSKMAAQTAAKGGA